MKHVSAIGGVYIPNYIPYLLLVIISFVLLILSWRKANHKALVPYFFCTVGIVYFFEYVTLILFKGYVYFPGVFDNSYFDNVLGANVSNGLIVPSAAIFIAAFELGFWWIALIAAVFMGIEELFLHLGIYRHFWYKTIYTGLSLLVLFHMGKWIWRIIRFRTGRFIRFNVLYYGNISVQGTFMFYLVAIFHLFFFRVNWFDDPSRGHIAFITLYFFVDSIFYSLAVILRAHWLWNVLLIGGLACINFLLLKLSVLEISSYWVLGLLTLLQTGELFLLMYMRKLLVNENLYENSKNLV
ncbi:hypothetical protein [Paenibacillus harenae]|uniref:hypothetical protein n=1 Tax=Paenibacillus harenae TaxID=306543 RepID=UPI0012EB79F2|nr:hypothetical protein [Paenibacillus harenae]